MKYTKGKFTIDEPVFIGKYGWNVEIMHPDHIGFYAQVSGNTKEEAVNNAKLTSISGGMYEAIKKYLDCEQNSSNEIEAEIEMQSLLKEIDNE